MAYTLEALAMGSAPAGEAVKRFPSTRVVPLGRELCLIPLTSKFLAELDTAYPHGSVLNFVNLPALAPSAVAWAEQLSRVGAVVFIAAEFFGGLGDQASIGWQNGHIAFGPVQAGDAINQALKWLGVIPGDQADEFDALQLGRYRHTEEWSVK